MKLGARVFIIMLVAVIAGGVVGTLLVKILETLNMFNIFYAVIDAIIAGIVAGVAGKILIKHMEKKKPGSVLGACLNQTDRAKKEFNIIAFIIPIIAVQLSLNLTILGYSFFYSLFYGVIGVIIVGTAVRLASRILIKQTERRSKS